MAKKEELAVKAGVNGDAHGMRPKWGKEEIFPNRVLGNIIVNIIPRADENFMVKAQRVLELEIYLNSVVAIEVNKRFGCSMRVHFKEEEMK